MLNNPKVKVKLEKERTVHEVRLLCGSPSRPLPSGQPWSETERLQCKLNGSGNCIDHLNRQGELIVTDQYIVIKHNISHSHECLTTSESTTP